MQTSRLALAVLAALTVASLSSNAEARPGTKWYQKVHSAPAFDVAAVPPYPTTEMPGIAAGKRGRGATKASRTGARSHRVAKASQRAPEGGYRPGVVRSGKTGKTARVDPRHAAKFQAYIDDLENNYGARVLFMGGGRAGSCGLANQHACGGGQALDVCQYSWGVVDRRCGLPSPARLARIARDHGLYEGAEWCRPDTGHVQVRFSGACSRNLYSAVDRFKRDRGQLRGEP